MSEKKTTDVERETTVTNEQLVKLLKASNDRIGALEKSLGEKTTREAGQVDYYHCNQCGERLESGKRCARHPNELVMGIGIVFNPQSNTVRVGAVSKS